MQALGFYLSSNQDLILSRGCWSSKKVDCVHGLDKSLSGESDIGNASSLVTKCGLILEQRIFLKEIVNDGRKNCKVAITIRSWKTK